MNNQPDALSRYARLIGLSYLFIIVAGIFGQIVVRGSLVVPGDAMATAARIAGSEQLWRWGSTSSRPQSWSPTS